MFDTSTMPQPVEGRPFTVDGLEGEFRDLTAARSAAGLHQQRQQAPRSLVIYQDGRAVDVKRA